MKLQVYKSLWGMDGNLEENVTRIVEAGYDGIEVATQEVQEPQRLKELLADHKLDLIALVYTEGDDHSAHFKRVVEQAVSFGPSKIVAHAGRDLMPFVKQVRFLVHALRIEESIGVPIAHETHRRRPFLSPMNTLALLRELPEIKLNIDYSHWCCVTESMLQDHTEALQISAEHAIHLHGRVGYENGPQVSDPRAPEWSEHVRLHELWWHHIIELQRARRAEVFTFTPEYGPPSYMHTLPNTNEPVADLWDVCLWGAERFRQQFLG